MTSQLHRQRDWSSMPNRMEYRGREGDSRWYTHIILKRISTCWFCLGPNILLICLRALMVDDTSKYFSYCHIYCGYSINELTSDKCLSISLTSSNYFTAAPPEILARGPKARRAYQMALKSGKTKNLRVPVMLVGQSCAGKTSLLRSLKRKSVLYLHLSKGDANLIAKVM